jgi:TrmH family RNA methyltransferase
LKYNKEKSIKIQDLQSPENAVFKKLESLTTSKGIKRNSEFLVYGAKVLPEVLKSHPTFCRSILFTPEQAESAIKLKPRDPDVAFSRLQLSEKLFAQLDVFGMRSPILLCRIPSLTTWSSKQMPQGLEVFCALSDPSNLGAVVRSAAAFGASRIILLKECANPFHPKAVRASAGAVFQLSFQEGPSIRDLKGDDEAPFVMLDLEGQSLNKFQWPRDVRLLIGEEGQGIPSTLEGLRVSIPMQKGVESLNAAVSASLAMFCWR